MKIIKYTKFNESVKNLFEKDLYLKNKYKKQVWDLLQNAYSEQGGIKGNGFNSPDEMLEIPFWKIDIIEGKVIAVFMYKFIKVNDVKIRKLIALGISMNQLKTYLKKTYILKINIRNKR